jgi:hypothetical protein
MTISSNTREAGPFVGNGTASNFAFTFKVFQASDLLVVRLNTTTGVETTLTLTTDYTVSLNDDQDSNPGGSITLVAGALATGFNLVITSDIPNLQPTDLTNQGGFYPEVISDSLDRATIQIQQLQGQIDRVIITPISDAAGNLELPVASFRANKIFSFDASGNPSVTLASFPGALTANYYIRVNSTASGYELRAPADTRADIGANDATNLTTGTVADARLPSTMNAKTLTNVSITSGSITGITDLAIADGGTGASTAANARTNLGLAIGSNVQAWHTSLDKTIVAYNTFSASDDYIMYWLQVSPGNWNATAQVITTFSRSLLDDTSATAARTTLGLGSLATLSTINNSNWSGTDLAVVNGGTGASDAATARTNLGATTVGASMFTLANPSAVTFPRFNADNTVSALDAATFRTAIGATGTVSGVTGTSPVVSSGGTAPVISLASGYGDTQNPYASKTANFVLAAPDGIAGVPTFRAIVAADIPTLNQNTTGTASNVTGTVAIANGGTGQTTRQAAMDALAGATTSGQYLRGNGTDVVMSAIQAADVPTLNQNTTGTASNVTGTVAIANGGTGETTRQNAMDALAGATTSGFYLRGNGTDVVMSAIQAADVPTLNQNTTGTAAGLSATLAVTSGGTGQTSYTDGQLLIGNTTGNTLTKATLTQGGGIAITNGAGSITVAVDSTVATLTGTQTLTNKRVTPRSVDIASATTITPTSDTADQYEVTALAAAATIAAPSGTPTDGQRLVIRIKDNGTGRALTWTTGSSGAFRAIGVTLPTTTVASKTMYIGCIYNAADLRWDAVAVSQEA